MDENPNMEVSNSEPTDEAPSNEVAESSLVLVPTDDNPQPGCSNDEPNDQARNAGMLVPLNMEQYAIVDIPRPRRYNEEFGKFCPACHFICRCYQVTRHDKILICENPNCRYPENVCRPQAQRFDHTDEISLQQVLSDFNLHDDELVEDFKYYVTQLEIAERAPLLLTRQDWAEHMMHYSQAYRSNEGVSAA